MNHVQLKTWRVTQNLTQRKAAEALGVSLSAYQYYEAGWRRINGERRPVKLPNWFKVIWLAISPDHSSSPIALPRETR